MDTQGLGRQTLERVVRDLGLAIPTGDKTHRGQGVEVPDSLLAAPLSTGTLEHAREALAHRHLGTLGGGNHFLELDRDADGGLWLLIHSGSRGLGAAIAHHHVRAAEAGTGELSGLDVRTQNGSAYMGDLSWALDFAKANRQRIEARALEVLGEVLPMTLAEDPIDIHHNFAARETWFGRALIVHRKGAVAIPSGALALIPGSMGTATQAQNIVQAMTNNAAAFPSPTPTLATVTTAIHDLQGAETATLSRTKGAATTRNEKRAALTKLLDQLKGYVQTVADPNAETSASIIQSAGMNVKRTTVRTARAFSAAPGGVSGSVDLITNAAARRASYEWQYSLDGGKTWLSAPSTLQAKTTVSGLTPGVTVVFRYRPVTKTGEGDWSQAISLIVK